VSRRLLLGIEGQVAAKRGGIDQQAGAVSRAMAGGARGLLLRAVALSCYPSERAVGPCSSRARSSLTHRFTQFGDLDDFLVELVQGMMQPSRATHAGAEDPANSGPSRPVLQLTHVVHQGGQRDFSAPSLCVRLQLRSARLLGTCRFSRVRPPLAEGKQTFKHRVHIALLPLAGVIGETSQIQAVERGSRPGNLDVHRPRFALAHPTGHCKAGTT